MEQTDSPFTDSFRENFTSGTQPNYMKHFLLTLKQCDILLLLDFNYKTSVSTLSYVYCGQIIANIGEHHCSVQVELSPV